MAYTKTTWVNDQQPDIDADNLNKMEQGIYDAQFPDGGTEGQILARTANGRGWVDPPNSAVWGGITGDIADQTDLQASLSTKMTTPSGGTTGQVLTKTATGQAWQDASGGGNVDTVNGIQPDVLTKNVQVDVEITKQGWDALPSTKYTDDINYYIKDGTNIPQAGVISASGVTYSNTSSGLDATTVQGAIDENASEIADVKAGLTTVINSDVPGFLLYKKGNIVFAQGTGLAFQLTEKAWTTIGTLPQGFRPMYQMLNVPIVGGDFRQYNAVLRIDNQSGLIEAFAEVATNYWMSTFCYATSL